MPLPTSPFQILPFTDSESSIYSSQSATSCYMECPRRYLYNYRLYGTGIVPKFSSVPLLVGGCLHKAVENIAGQWLTNTSLGNDLRVDIDSAVAIAKESYREEISRRPLSTPHSQEEETEQQFVIQEQLALVEAMVRLWYIKEWPKIIEYYDILAVEQEIAFPLGLVIYQSKPDLILLHKKNGDVINYSLKSVKQGGDRLEKSYKVQLQAVTEPYATSIWLMELQEILQNARDLLNATGNNLPYLSFMSKGLRTIGKTLEKYSNLPTRSSATRFCYIIKGDRKEIKKGSGKYRTDNPFIYGLRKIGVREIEYAWSWFYPKPENDSGWGRLGKGWEQFPIWEDREVGGIKGWIEKLAKGNDIQADLGQGHVFDKYILSQPDVYTNWGLIESRIQELKIIEDNIFTSIKNLDYWAKQEEATTIIASMLAEGFPMNTNSCFFPTPCSYLSICPNGNDYYKEHIALNPLNEEFGAFERRVSHHEPEKKEMERM